MANELKTLSNQQLRTVTGGTLSTWQIIVGAFQAEYGKVPSYLKRPNS